MLSIQHLGTYAINTTVYTASVCDKISKVDSDFSSNIPISSNITEVIKTVLNSF